MGSIIDEVNQEDVNGKLVGNDNYLSAQCEMNSDHEWLTNTLNAVVL